MESEEHDLGESGWGRRKELSFAVDERDGMYCDACERVVRCVVVGADTSNGEYGSLGVCEECLLSMLAAFKARGKRGEARDAALCAGGGSDVQSAG